STDQGGRDRPTTSLHDTWPLFIESYGARDGPTEPLRSPFAVRPGPGEARRRGAGDENPRNRRKTPGGRALSHGGPSRVALSCPAPHSPLLGKAESQGARTNSDEASPICGPSSFCPTLRQLRWS